jgi:hypothetical protein
MGVVYQAEDINLGQARRLEIPAKAGEKERSHPPASELFPAISSL